MKKNIFKCVLVILFFIIICGCGKEKDKLEEYDISKWNIDTSTKLNKIDEESKKVFESATKEDENKYELVALLGTQIVAGRNYIFLAKHSLEDEIRWYAVRIYEDLDGKSEITYEKEIDISNYTYEKEYIFDEETANIYSEISGGWSINSNINTKVDDNVVSLLKSATSNLSKVTYKPIALISKQKTTGTHYAVLSLGTLENEQKTNIISLISFYEDTDGNTSINGICNIDLAAFSN